MGSSWFVMADQPFSHISTILPPRPLGMSLKKNVSLSGNCSGAVASSGIGGTLALTGNTTAVSSGTYFVTDVSFSQAADGFNSFDLSATSYDGLNT